MKISILHDPAASQFATLTVACTSCGHNMEMQSDEIQRWAASRHLLTACERMLRMVSWSKAEQTRCYGLLLAEIEDAVAFANGKPYDWSDRNPERAKGGAE